MSCSCLEVSQVVSWKKKKKKGSGSRANGTSFKEVFLQKYTDIPYEITSMRTLKYALLPCVVKVTAKIFLEEKCKICLRPASAVQHLLWLH